MMMDPKEERDAKMEEDVPQPLRESEKEALQAAVALLRRDPRAIASPELAFLKDYLLSLGATMWLPDDAMAALQDAVRRLEETPKLLLRPEMSFLRAFVKSWQGTGIAPAGSGPGSPTGWGPTSPGPAQEEEGAATQQEEAMELEPEELEPEEPEEDPERLPQDAGPFPERPSEVRAELPPEELALQESAKQAAQEAAQEGRLEDAVNWYTEAVKLNPSALLYDKRADLLLRLRRPNACIADCTAALAINPDIGKAFRLRGKAHRRLGHWEEAHKDLSMGQHLDFDDDTVEEHSFVDGIWKKISDRLTRKRLREERAARQQQLDEIKRHKEAALRGQTESQQGEFVGVPADFLDDPELSAAWKDPRFAAAMRDIIADWTHVVKYQDDPEVMHCVTRLLDRMGSSSGSKAQT